MSIKNRMGFLSLEDLVNLTNNEVKLYQIALSVELCKISAQLTPQSEVIETQLLDSSWGQFLFKPPRASAEPYLTLMQNELLNACIDHELVLLGRYVIAKLSKKHLKAIYPGDSQAVYWSELLRCLVGKPAVIYLVKATQPRNVSNDIRNIKGWFKSDLSRDRLIDKVGLRAKFSDLVLTNEATDLRVQNGSPLYEDTGVHAPCSVSSRYLQLLGLMGIDIVFAEYVRDRINL